LYLGEWAEASTILQQGLMRAEELGNLERQAGFRAGLALAARGQNDPERARTLLTEALALIAEHGYWHLRTRIQLWLAETCPQLDAPTEAEHYLDAALHTAQANGRTLLLIQGQRLQARQLATHQEWQAASDLFQHAWEQANDLDLALEAARTQAAWGEAMRLYAPTPDERRRGQTLP